MASCCFLENCYSRVTQFTVQVSTSTGDKIQAGADRAAAVTANSRPTKGFPPMVQGASTAATHKLPKFHTSCTRFSDGQLNQLPVYQCTRRKQGTCARNLCHTRDFLSVRLLESDTNPASNRQVVRHMQSRDPCVGSVRAQKLVSLRQIRFTEILSSSKHAHTWLHSCALLSKIIVTQKFRMSSPRSHYIYAQPRSEPCASHENPALVERLHGSD